MPQITETAIETVIEAHLLANGYVAVDRAGFDRAWATFPWTVLSFIQETQPKEWDKLEALHGDKTGEQILKIATRTSRSSSSSGARWPILP